MLEKGRSNRTRSNEEIGSRLYTKSGLVNLVDEEIIEYYISTKSGQSGGPIFNRNNFVWGIHTYGYGNTSSCNFGTKIDECIFSVLRENKEQGIRMYH